MALVRCATPGSVEANVEDDGHPAILLGASSGDDVLDALLTITADILQSFPTPPLTHGPHLLHGYVLQLPGHNEAIDAFSRDTELMKLFPGGSETPQAPLQRGGSRERKRSTVFSTGSSLDLHLPLMAGNLLSYAVLRAQMARQPLSLSSLTPLVAQAVKDLRNLARAN